MKKRNASMTELLPAVKFFISHLEELKPAPQHYSYHGMPVHRVWLQVRSSTLATNVLEGTVVQASPDTKTVVLDDSTGRITVDLSKTRITNFPTIGEPCALCFVDAPR